MNAFGSAGSIEFDESVETIMEKLTSLPLLKRHDPTAVSLALAILSAKHAQDEKAEKHDFKEMTDGAWDIASKLE